jgi:hypothetical protein
MLKNIVHGSEEIVNIVVHQLEVGERQFLLLDNNAALTIAISVNHDSKEEEWILALRKLITPLQPTLRRLDRRFRTMKLKRMVNEGATTIRPEGWTVDLLVKRFLEMVDQMIMCCQVYLIHLH